MGYNWPFVPFIDTTVHFLDGHSANRTQSPPLTRRQGSPTFSPMHKPFFTAENARQYAALSAEVRRAKALSAPADHEQSADAQADGFTTRRLARVRIQLGMLDEAIEAEARKRQPDGQKIDRLAAAQFRLSEQERVLAGRPLPGSRRPGREPRGRTVDVETVDLGPTGQAALPSPVQPAVAPLIQPTIQPVYPC
jgi:hypothetical protein